MSEPRSFLDRTLTGHVLFDEIDEYVDRWHRGDSTDELHEYLGMTPSEYSLWLGNPEMLSIICTARRRRQPLTEAVSEALPDLLREAKSDDGARIKTLEAWLRGQEEQVDRSS